MTSLPQNPAGKKLGLVIDLDTCLWGEEFPIDVVADGDDDGVGVDDELGAADGAGAAAAAFCESPATPGRWIS